MIKRIQAKNIRKQYNSKFTLSCSIEIGQGPLYAVAGPNGSGKSTLLRIIGLLEPPDNGEIFYHDRNSQLTNPYRNISLRRNVVLVPTRPVLFDETVFDNAAYGLRLRKSDKQATKDRVMEVLNAVKIGNMAKRNAKELSSGEAQRLALARALVLDPDVAEIQIQAAGVCSFQAKLCGLFQQPNRLRLSLPFRLICLDGRFLAARVFCNERRDI